MDNSYSSIKKFANNMRKNILTMALNAGTSSSHFGGALSITDIIATLYSHRLRINNSDPEWNERDRFILSKGHACLAYYSALSEVGYISKEELLTFEKNDSNLLGHPVINKKLGIEFSNGSLGMGLSLGIGIAKAIKLKKKENNVYVVLGDGECNEGSVWEAAMAAPNLKLDNLYAIIDKNNFQQTGSNEDIMSVGRIKDKWESFGWHTEEVDGHDINQICDFFENTKNIKNPKALIAKTIKGKGFSFSENNNDWHHKILTKSLYDLGMKELDLDNI